MTRDKRKKQDPRNQRSVTQEMVGDVLYLKKHWLALGAQDRKVGWRMEVAAIQRDRWD